MYRIGVDLGGTKIACGLVSGSGELLHKEIVWTESEKGLLHVVQSIHNRISLLLSYAGVSLDEILGIGIGSPGLIDRKNGVILKAGNLGFRNAPILDELGKYFSIPLFLANDANCAALGETISGGGRGCSDAILVTLGTGIGGGVIIGGRIFEGSDGFGGELGHILFRYGGESCSCGRNGCWEVYASATALINQTRRAIEENPGSIMAALSDGGRDINGNVPFEAAEKGDSAARAVIRAYSSYVAEGIIDLVNIFRPEVVLIGGGVSSAGEGFISMVDDYVKKYSCGSPIIPSPPVKRAVLGNDAGIIGAAFLSSLLCQETGR
jgi:glucokinase